MPGYRKLGRSSAHRKAMLRNLVTDLLREGRITTTDTRAKEARRQAEKMITLAKRGDLHARRQLLASVLCSGPAKGAGAMRGGKEISPKDPYTLVWILGRRITCGGLSH